MSRVFYLVGAAVLVAWASTGACSATTATGSTGSGGSAGATSTSTASSAGGQGGSIVGSTSSATGGAGGGCVGTASKATPVPLDIFVMLDQSGSMNLDSGNGTSRWVIIRGALTSFMQQPGAAGIGLGLQYFGLGDPDVPGCTTHPCTTDADCTAGCTTCSSGVCHSPYNPDIDACDPVEYAWAEVPIAPLPGVSSAILSSLAMHAPGTNTPTAPALGGAIDYAKQWAVSHPGHVTVVAFATDGDPSDCDTSIVDIEATAGAGASSTPSIKTYVVGVGPSLMNLDGIAAAGGTTAAFHVDMDPMAQQEFLDAMNTIRGAAIQCTYQIPPPPPGMTEDFSLVNVTYTPGDGGAHEILPKVQDEAHCPPSGDAWHYDDDQSPTEIILCAKTCSAISPDIQGSVEVVIGCKTILK